MKRSQNNISAYPMEKLVPLILEFTSSGKQVVITGRGNSMLPLVRSGKDHLKLASCMPETLKPGDIVLYKRDSGSYVVHRIISVLPDKTFVMKGDSQTWAEKGIKASQILAKVTAIIRGEKEISVENKGYLRYARFWTRSKKIRAVYEFFLKIRLKNKSKK